MSAEYPQPGALISLNDAKQQNRCRICGERIAMPNASPVGWKDEFGEMLYPPPAITLKYGKEFAHTQCLKDAIES